MKPDSTSKPDVIDALLQSTWENPPGAFEQQLMSIPSQVYMHDNRQLDRFSTILNGILIFWGAGLLMFFWTPLKAMLTTLSQSVIGFSALSPQLLTHPIVALSVLALLLFGWVWMDTEKPPGIIKV
ncbi:MAG: hypothetical protein HQ506_02120 [Candidatus Marinimicrobia bacterium]|nr:hypothetical protein [Candidatus Neomarinimicrobiota bacterium]